MGVLRGCIVVMALAGAGCFAPGGRDCAVRCSTSGACPSGFTCLSDGYCHEGSDRTTCGGGDAGGGDGAGEDAAPGTMTLDLVTDADTFIEDGAREADNFGGDVAIGIDGGTVSGSHILGLVHFDVSGVPAGKMMAAAPVLRICSTDDPIETGTVAVHKVLERWSEGLGSRDAAGMGDPGVANWTQRMAATPWTTAGTGTPGSRDETPATVGGATLAPVTADTTYTIDIEPTVVEAWIADSAVNFGLALVPSTDAASGFLVAREGIVADCQPRLTVVVFE